MPRTSPRRAPGPPLSEALRDLRAAVQLHLRFFPVHLHPSATVGDDEHDRWEALPGPRRREHVLRLAERVVPFARADDAETRLLEDFLRRWGTDHHMALVRELFALRPPPIDRALSRLRRFLALAAKRAREEWAEPARELRRRYPPKAVAAGLREYGDRVLRFADEERVDAGPLRAALDRPTAARLPGARRVLEALVGRLESNSHWAMSGDLRLALLLAKDLLSAARPGPAEPLRRDRAEQAFHQLRGALDRAGASPARGAWHGLVACQFLAKLASRLEPAAAEHRVWADLWQALAPGLARVRPPDFEALDLAVRQNLSLVLEGDEVGAAWRIPPAPPGLRSFLREVGPVTPPSAGPARGRPARAERDGVYGGYFVHRGRKHRITKPRSKRVLGLLGAMLKNDEVTFEELTGPGEVWPRRVSPKSYATVAARLNALLPAGFPWEVRTSGYRFHKLLQEIP